MQISHFKLFVITIIAVVAVLGCKGLGSTPQIAGCVKENQRLLLIRWGTEDTLKQVLYTLNTKGEVFRTVSSYQGVGSTYVTTDSTKITEISHDTFCSTVSEVQSSFLKTQALNTSGSHNRYIDIINPGTSVYLRAVWNPKLSTFQSRDMRSQYESLMELIPKDEQVE